MEHSFLELIVNMDYKESLKYLDTSNSSAKDTISKVKPISDESFLAASWDNCLRLYDISDGIKSIIDTKSPILDVGASTSNSSAAAVVCLNGKLHLIDLETERIVSTFRQSHASRNTVTYLSPSPILLTTSWNGAIHLIDPRSNQVFSLINPLQLASSHTTTTTTTTTTTIHKPFAVTITNNRIIIATSDNNIDIYTFSSEDLIKRGILSFTKPNQPRPTLSQVRSITTSPDSSHYAYTTVDGRVAVEYIKSSQKHNSFSFRCHSRIQGLKELIFPVNTIAFNSHFVGHSNNNNGATTFATGGSDGVVNIWDSGSKKKLASQKFSEPISSIAFLPGENYNALVVAASYGFDRGPLTCKKKTVSGIEEEDGGGGEEWRKQGRGSNGVYVKFLTDLQIKPKDTTAAATVSSSQRYYR
jgi:hypothetical protein